MAIKDSLLPEFDREVALTRKSLERTPDGKFDWQPHKKSMTLGRLASHLAEIPGRVVDALTTDSFDVAPAGGPKPQAANFSTRAEVLAAFDKNVKNARAALQKTSDADWAKSWALLSGGQTIFNMPRTAVMRGFVISHMIHHRAQFGVYLRMNEVPVPSIYGPSADEGR